MTEDKAISDRKVERARKRFAEWTEKFAGGLAGGPMFEDIRRLFRRLGVSELVLDDALVAASQILAGTCSVPCIDDDKKPEKELYLEVIRI